MPVPGDLEMKDIAELVIYLIYIYILLFTLISLLAEQIVSGLFG